MNVTIVNSTAITKITEAVKVKYNMSTRGAESVKEITAQVYKDEEVVGFFNISKNGVTGFSLREGHGLTVDEVKLVFQSAIDDSMMVLG